VVFKSRSLRGHLLSLPPACLIEVNSRIMDNKNLIYPVCHETSSGLDVVDLSTRHEKKEVASSCRFRAEPKVSE